MGIPVQYRIPILIFLISLCFHFSLISKGPVSLDCLNLAIKSQETIETQHLQYLFGSGYPLMVILGSIFIYWGKYIGINDIVVAVNFIGVIFSSIAIPTFYFLVKRISKNNLAPILASFFLLLNPLFLDVSTYGINHAPALCFLLMGLLTILRYQESANIFELLLSAVFLGLMGATRLQDFVLTFPAVSFIFIMGLETKIATFNKNRIPNFILFITVIDLIILLFHLPYFIFDHANYAIQANDFWRMGLSENFHGLFGKPFRFTSMYLYLAFSIVGIVYFGAGLFYIAKSNKKLFVFILLWWLIPLLFYGNTSTSAPRFLNILLPAMIIPISIFLSYLIQDKKRLWDSIALISCLTIIIQPLLSIKETFIRRHHVDLIADYYDWVGHATEPNAIIISADDTVFIKYYSKRQTLSKPVSAVHLSPVELNNFKKKLDNLLGEGKPVYITNVGFTQYDIYREFNHLMCNNYRLILIGQRPLELWYATPLNDQLHLCSLVKILKK